MANTISKAFVEQFKSNLIHLAEQQGSRLRSTVTEQSVTGEKFHFERIGNVAAVQKALATLRPLYWMFHTVVVLVT